ncbi:hypothetical protein HDU98_005686, partial [Podochytrium sp. JEL0797]
YLHDNKFTGPVPIWILDMDDLKNLDLSENMFTGQPSGSIVAKLESIQHLRFGSQLLDAQWIPRAHLAPRPERRTLPDWPMQHGFMTSVPTTTVRVLLLEVLVVVTCTVGDENSACDIPIPAV